METLGDWVDVAPWKSPIVLIIDPATYRTAGTLGDKRSLLDSVSGDALLIAAWGGQWRTTARLFGANHREKVRERLG